MSKAYEQVFGQANLSAPVKDGSKIMRVGKTARDKAKGHIAGKKNRRVWDEDKGSKSSGGRWVKV